MSVWLTRTHWTPDVRVEGRSPVLEEVAVETLEANVALQRGLKPLSVWINLLGLIALSSVDRVNKESAITRLFRKS